MQEIEKVDDRKVIGERLRDVFNAMFDQATLQSYDHELSWRDMKEVTRKLEKCAIEEGLAQLPASIQKALFEAEDLLDPNKIKGDINKANRKYYVLGLLGFTCMAYGIFSMVFAPSRSIFRVAWEFVLGDDGKAFPFSVVIGLGMIGFSMYGIKDRETPKERAVKCNKLVNSSIDTWIKYGD